jgi:4-carboxymuconolactone decarboxylase
MPRVRLIEERSQASPSQMDVFDHISASRGGQMIRPYAAMLHRPEIARAAADLGAVIRFESTLSDHDRELVIVSTAAERNCHFEWESHHPLAVAAGVADATLDAVANDTDVTDEHDAVIVEFVRSLCRAGRIADGAFQALVGEFGQEGTVEVAATVGYYSMMAVFMSACDLC